jgi:hypothetical protein
MISRGITNFQRQGKKKDPGFTNIRVSEDTRNELSKIGHHGDSMDDIVKYWKTGKK